MYLRDLDAYVAGKTVFIENGMLEIEEECEEHRAA